MSNDAQMRARRDLENKLRSLDPELCYISMRADTIGDLNGPCSVAIHEGWHPVGGPVYDPHTNNWNQGFWRMPSGRTS